MLVKVVTPDKSFFDGKADAVFLPASDGEVGILANHAPMIAKLGHGVLRVKEGEKTTRIAIYGGFLKVQDDSVSVLAGGAAVASGDKASAQKALDAAQDALTAARGEGKVGAALSTLEEDVRRARAFLALVSE